MISAVEAEVTINIDGDLIHHNSFIKYDDSVYINLRDLPYIAKHCGANLDLDKLFDFSRYGRGEVLFFELDCDSQIVPYLDIKRIEVTCLKCGGFREGGMIAHFICANISDDDFKEKGKPVKSVYLN